MKRTEAKKIGEAVFLTAKLREKLKQLDYERDISVFNGRRCQVVEGEIRRAEETIRGLSAYLRRYGVSLR